VKQLGLEDASRLNQAKTLLLERDAALLHALDARYKLRVYFCSDSARRSREISANCARHPPTRPHWQIELDWVTICGPFSRRGIKRPWRPSC